MGGLTAGTRVPRHPLRHSPTDIVKNLQQGNLICLHFYHHLSPVCHYIESQPFLFSFSISLETASACNSCSSVFCVCLAGKYSVYSIRCKGNSLLINGNRHKQIFICI